MAKDDFQEPENYAPVFVQCSEFDSHLDTDRLLCGADLMFGGDQDSAGVVYFRRPTTILQIEGVTNNLQTAFGLINELQYDLKASQDVAREAGFRHIRELDSLAAQLSKSKSETTSHWRIGMGLLLLNLVQSAVTLWG